MTAPETKTPFVAIACGGTGGHLFPGLAVAGELKKRGCKIALLISPKDIDQQSVKSAHGMEIFTLPAVGLQNRNYFSFALEFLEIISRLAENFQATQTRRRAGDGRIYQPRRRFLPPENSARKLSCTNPTPFPDVPTVFSRDSWTRRLSDFPKPLHD